VSTSRNKRSLTIAGHRTSISLEEAFWTALADIAAEDGTSIAALIGEIDRARSEGSASKASLSAAIRLYVLQRMRSKPSAS
jgi:predicted DNA-binding ribbon-helix-helix protein